MLAEAIQKVFQSGSYNTPTRGKSSSLATARALNVFFFSFFGVLGFELRAYTSSHSMSPLLKVFFKIGSHKLFAWAGFEPQSS
jgi:hypothetical protein